MAGYLMPGGARASWRRQRRVARHGRHRRPSRMALSPSRGRAKRFAKIGGEMVSLAAVEALASSLWPDTSHVVVSSARSEEGREPRARHRQAERGSRRARRCTLAPWGFAELSVPKAVLSVAAIPVLGSGKVDLPATLELARSDAGAALNLRALRCPAK